MGPIENIEVIGGAGAIIVIAVLVVRFLMVFVTRQQKTIENHIHHNTEVMVKLVAAIEEQTRTSARSTKAFEELTAYMKQRDINRDR